MFIFITVCNKGFHKANRISMLLKLKRTQRNLSSTNREVHSCCTSFSVVKLWINPAPGWLLTLTVPEFLVPVPWEGVTLCLWGSCFSANPTSTACLPSPLFSTCLHINLKHLLSCIFSSGEWIVVSCSQSYRDERRVPGKPGQIPLKTII